MQKKISMNLTKDEIITTYLAVQKRIDHCTTLDLNNEAEKCRRLLKRLSFVLERLKEDTGHS